LDFFRRICCFICPCALGDPPPPFVRLLWRTAPTCRALFLLCMCLLIIMIGPVPCPMFIRTMNLRNTVPKHFHDSDKVAWLVHTNISVVAWSIIKDLVFNKFYSITCIFLTDHYVAFPKYLRKKLLNRITLFCCGKLLHIRSLFIYLFRRQWARALSFNRFLDHTTTHHSR
jgi:hypothetical protein